MSWVVWITGLPGCGKSSVAAALKKEIPEAEVLSMDELRRTATPEPTYSDSERDHLYRGLVYTAKRINDLGYNVILDATANRQSWRELARNLVTDFYEVYLKCPLETCIKRETERTDRHAAPPGIYEKGGKGAPVPGLNTVYEEPGKPDLTIDTTEVLPAEAAKLIVRMLTGNKQK